MNNTTSSPSNAVAWFEIPTADFAKSIPFYNQVLGVSLEAKEFGPAHLAIFPHTKPGAGGCLLQEAGLKPAAAGTIVYLPTEKIDAAIEQVEPGGGKVVIPKTPIGPNMGYFARFQDPEGNLVGLFGLQ